MITLQEAGTQILGGNPGKFYVLLGEEYGVKMKYIDAMHQKYGESVEAASVQELLSMFKSRHLVPLKPKLYIVRYDETFVASLSEAVAKQIKSANIVGTVVCVYENSKHATKLDKYLPEYTVTIDHVNDQFVKRYLHTDFPELPDRLINIAVDISSNYGHAKNICKAMSFATVEKIFQMSDSEISKTFGYVDLATEQEIKRGIASRNFAYLVKLVDKFDGDVDTLLYAILSTMLEIDAMLDNPRKQSDLREFVKRWTREDVYYMFVQTYEVLKKLRSMSISDPKNCLIYLLGLLQFEQIPSIEVMS